MKTVLPLGNLKSNVGNCRAMVQVAPGKWMPRGEAEPPEVSLCRWQGNGDGTYRPDPQVDRLVRLDAKLARLLGFEGRWRTLERLGRMGCIEIITVSPRFRLINLASWFNHLRKCAEDPELWNEGRGYVEEYRKVIE